MRRGLTVLVLPVSGALIAAGCGGGSAGDVQANIENFAFDPKQLTAKVGETVSWKNDDSTTHTVTADDLSFDSGNLASDKTFSEKFDKPGTIKYHCAIHASMIATVVVS